MQECQNCERLLQRIADLNSELLVLKIAAFAGGNAASKSRPKPAKASKLPSTHRPGAPCADTGSN